MSLVGSEAYRWGRAYVANLIGGPLDGAQHGFPMPVGEVVAPALITLQVTHLAIPGEREQYVEKLRYERIRVDPDDPLIGFYQLMKQ